MSPLAIRLVLLILFVISGFGGLIYESVWSHYLKTLLGHAAYGQTLVLLIFMGGLGLGSWIAGRFVHRLSNPIRAFAIIELALGFMAIGFHTVFLQASQFYYDVAVPQVADVFYLDLLKWTLGGLLILPQAMLMGATFPLLSVGVIRLLGTPKGETLSLLYFTNSLGAALGVLASGFLLIPLLGLPGAMLTAGFLELLVAFITWFLAKQIPDALPTAELAKPTITADTRRFALLIYSFTFATAMASFFYEIGWIRMLSLVLGSSVQSFELMLSAFILGLAFGGYWVKSRVDRLENPLRFLATVQFLMGFCALLTIPLYHFTFDLMAWLLSAVSRNDAGYGLMSVMSQGLAMLVMFPSTFFAGMTLPLLTVMLLRRQGGEAAVGQVYAANTLGAVTGIWIAVHLVMPSLGTKNLILLGAGIDMLLGVLLFALAFSGDGVADRWGRFARGAVATAVLVIGVQQLFTFDVQRMSAGVFRTGQVREGGTNQVMFHEDGKTATVSVVSQTATRRAIKTNGKVDAAMIVIGDQDRTSDEATMILLGLIPLALKPDATLVANVGFGSGLTTHVLLGRSTIERVDTVEIEPKMIEGAKLFGERVARAYNDPRSHIHLEDAKTFFVRNRQPYDIIVSEPSNPWVSGVASLYTTEFYTHVKPYLKADGIYVQWSHLYEMDFANLSSILAAVGENFRHYAIYSMNAGDIMIVASDHSEAAVTQLDGALFGDKAVAADAKRLEIQTVDDLKDRLMTTRPYVHDFFLSQGSPVNSDFFPFLMYHAPQAFFKQSQITYFLEWRYGGYPVLAWLNGLEQMPTFERLGEYQSQPQFAKEARDIWALLQNPDAAVEPFSEYAPLQWLLSVLDGRATADSPAATVQLANALVVTMAQLNYLPWDTQQLALANLMLRPGFVAIDPRLQQLLEMRLRFVEKDHPQALAIAESLLETYRKMDKAVAPDAFLQQAELASLFPHAMTLHLLIGDTNSAYKLLTEVWEKLPPNLRALGHNDFLFRTIRYRYVMQQLAQSQN